MSEINSSFAQLGANFSALRFECAPVADYLARLERGGGLEGEGGVQSARDGGGAIQSGGDGGEGGQDGRGLDVLVALHACDTATDDALWCGITNHARVIVTVPCCHKQVRRQLELASATAAADGPAALGGPLSAALRHGIYRERLAETVTDALRALLLEISGYDVSVFEFIGGEHTAKNVMIAATLRSRSRDSDEIEALLLFLHPDNPFLPYVAHPFSPYLTI